MYPKADANKPPLVVCNTPPKRKPTNKKRDAKPCLRHWF